MRRVVGLAPRTPNAKSIFDGLDRYPAIVAINPSLAGQPTTRFRLTICQRHSAGEDEERWGMEKDIITVILGADVD
jgi:hypothetical protein